METKQIKISELIPEGYEIDKEKSTFENIILKPIEEKLPLSVWDIPDLDIAKYDKPIKAFRELLLLRDAWNGDWKADWNDSSQMKHCIYFYRKKLIIDMEDFNSFPLNFKTKELAEKFSTQFKDLINEAKELL